MPPKRRYSGRRSKRIRRTYSMAKRYRRFYSRRRRGTSRGRFSRVKRVWRRLGNNYIRPQNYYNSDIGQLSSNGYIIRYFDGIAQGAGGFNRTGDIITAVPGGWLKLWIRMNPAWLSGTNANQYNVYGIRVITLRITDPNMTVFPPDGNSIFAANFVTPNNLRPILSFRNINTTKDIRVLSDRSYTLSLNGRQEIRVFRKHNWKGKVVWDINTTTPKTGFYYTIFVTDLQQFQDFSPFLIDAVWKVNWLNTT